MCECINVEFGSFDNQVETNIPSNIKIRREVFGKNIIIDKLWVDACVAEELKILWKNGIKTYGHCCGHNKIIGFFNVGEYFDDCIKLGYKKYIFDDYSGGNDREDSVIPRSCNYYGFNYRAVGNPFRNENDIFDCKDYYIP